MRGRLRKYLWKDPDKGWDGVPYERKRLRSEGPFPRVV